MITSWTSGTAFYTKVLLSGYNMRMTPFQKTSMLFRDSSNSSVVHNASDGSDPGTPATPLAKPLVLSRPYQVHPAPVVWVLVEEPVAVGHVAGEDVVYVEAVHDTGTVIHQIHHLTSKLYPLIQAHVEWPRFLVTNRNGELFSIAFSQAQVLYYFYNNIKFNFVPCSI